MRAGRRGPLDVSGDLLERDEELDDLCSALEGAAAGAGCMSIVLGAAGIGKTRLLDAVSSSAVAGGVRVLTARGTPLERDFAFGIARQLLEPGPSALDAATRDEAMTGAGALALPVVDPDATTGVATAGDTTFAAIHGLYWTIANLAERVPLLLGIDDVHWADAASLRWLAYLEQRLEGLRVMVACALRRGDPAAESGPLRTLRRSAHVRIIELGPLSVTTTAELVRRQLGTVADDDLCRACHEASGGNPLLLGLVVDALGGAPAPSAEQVGEVGAAAVAPHVDDRLANLPSSCRAVAEAAAILGPGAGLSEAAALAGLDVLIAADAADNLVRAELLEPGDDLAFAHPLLRDAVEAELPLHRRAALHARAATVLRRNGAPAERVAAHLLAAPPTQDADAAMSLVAAARQARARGDPELAVRFLRRSLAESASFTDRPRAVLELGLLEAALMDAAAEARLREALDICTTPADRAAAARGLGSTLLLARRGDEGTQLLERVHAELEPLDREAALTVLAALASLGNYVFSTRRRIAPQFKRIRSMELAGATRTERSALGPLAMQAARDGERADVIVALARRALGGPAEEQRAEDHSVQGALLALWAAGELHEMEDRLGAMLEDAQRRASPLGVQTASGLRGLARLAMGRLRESEADTRTALNVGREHSFTSRETVLLGMLVPALVDQGRYDEAEAELADVRLPPNWEEAWPALVFHLGVARLRKAQHRGAEASVELRRCAELAESWSLRGLFNIPWRSELALIAPSDEGLRLAVEEFEIAVSAGAPAPVGIALRARALLAAGEERIALLREAAEVLERSPATLEYARTLIEFGAALRRANRKSEARTPLRKGIDLAYRCGATAVVERGEIEIRATGARPRRLLVSGLDALTASERRVAELAANGVPNRNIAQALFITTKTVETHLRHVYEKLGVTSRGDLPEALAAEVPARSGSVNEESELAR